MSKKLIIIAVIALLVLLVIILLAAKAPEPAEEISFTEPETASETAEVVPLASGKQVYEIMTDSSRRFKITEVEIDPLDVKQGEDQKVTVQVKDAENEPITQENKVEGLVYTDNKSFPFSFSLKKVEDLDGATVTTWEGSWFCQDTYDKMYMMSIKAKSATQEYSIDLTFR